ncbi:MAG: tetratricopeptide repeat protein [Chloroflexota bacterium]|nr:MAG: tetratricopeptide repeat protein [Chloroflexota bacterium]
MKKSIFVLGIVGISLLVALWAGTGLLSARQPADGTAMSAANRLAEAGNFAEAIQVYEGLVAREVQDSALFYNLGNAYYYQGDLGRAILNYQRAVQLAPRDADIRANLALARAQAGDPFLASPAGPLGILTDLTGRWLNINDAAVLTLAFWFAAGALLLARRFAGPSRAKDGLRYAALIAILLVAVSGLSLGARVYAEHTLPEGIVIAPTVALSSEPGNQYATGYSLNGGTAVNILETQGDWARLAAPDDSIEGWIPLDSVETVAGRQPDAGIFALL